MKNKHIGNNFEDHLKEKLKDKNYREEFEKQKVKIEIAVLVKNTRIKAGFTQQDIAEKTGLKQSFISRLEKASVSYLPRMDTIKRIFEALGYSVELQIKKAA
jgi:DNA-binding XRE family transcriptional regulator